MKDFQFSIKMTSKGLGYLSAETLEEAKEKIKNEEWDDIYDEIGQEFGELIEITETK